MKSRNQKSSLRRLLGFLFLCSLTLCLWLGHFPLSAQTPDASQLVQQGIERYQAGDLTGAIERWKTALTFYQKTHDRANEAIVIENLARAYQQIGQSEEAIAYWERAIAYYRQIQDLQQVGRMLTEQAQAYIILGRPRKAIALLCGTSNKEQVCGTDSALQIAHTYKDRQTEAAALGSLGDAYRLDGDYKPAIKYLEASLKIAEEINNLVYISSTFNNLGNAYFSLAHVNYRRARSAGEAGDATEAEKFKNQAFNYDNQALEYFENSLQIARDRNDQQGEMRVLLNLIPLYRRTCKGAKLSCPYDTVVQQSITLLERLPDSRDKVYAAIELANFVQPIPSDDATSPLSQCLPKKVESKALDLLNQAVGIARRLQDSRSESFALGHLGHIYECRQDYQQALKLTHQAALAAEQKLNAKDSLYLWEWQAGRIFKAQNNSLAAIKAYERAVAILEGIRSDILIANRDLQFDFRDNVEPIYRDLVELKLSLKDSSTAFTKQDNSSDTLSSVLTTVDSLKLAELQNYFGNDCVITAVNEKRVDLVGEDTVTAVFSSIILKNRTAIIVSLPNGEKKFKWINVDNNHLREEVNEFRIGLENYGNPIYNPQQAQKLYNWIVHPFVDDLKSAQIKTLVFIQDGILLSVPMAALHDGEKFLVEKYAIATTPSLTLTEAKTLNNQQLRALALGLTKDAVIDGRTFPALNNVASEISSIEAEMPDSKQLLDDNFTRDRLRQELGKTVYPIIHIATHGEFGSVPEDTFLVTGNNDKLTITELENIIRSVTRGNNTVDLLALTACETALGDDRAALGLAGVAVQAGVRSALASLWSIDDTATVKFSTNFYQEWAEGMSKAEALAAAQRALISAQGKYAHPAYWAPFVLIGNWL